MDGERKNTNESDRLLKKRDAIIAEIDALLKKLEARRRVCYAEIESGSLTEYNRLLSHMARWGRIAAAMRCCHKLPEPITSMMNDEERDLYDRAAGIVKRIQKNKQ